MDEEVAAWLEGNADRAQSRQRAQADAMKLIATFVVGIAAALVAAGLQEDPVNRYDHWSAALLAVSVVLTVAVVIIDRLVEPDHADVLEQATVRGWDAKEIRQELRIATMATSRDNEKVLWEIRLVLAVQVLVAFVSGTVATAGLLGSV